MLRRKDCASTFHRLPLWPCPSCDGGELRGSEMRYGAAAGVAPAIDGGYLEQWDDSGVFSDVLTCSNRRCQGSVVVTGIYTSYPESDDGRNTHIGRRLTVKGIYPAVSIISWPDYTPHPVTEALRRSFSLFWSDPQACVATIRTCIERLLDQFSPPGDKYVALAIRLQSIAMTHPDLMEAGRLIKDLGNEGAHGHDIDRDQLLAVYELLELELKVLFNDDNERRKQLRDQLKTRAAVKKASSNP